MGLWDWVLSFAAEVRANGDRERIRLVEFTGSASGLSVTDPELALTVIADGQQLARQLGEPRFVLLLEHFRLQILMNRKQDYRQVLDLAVQATLEARKPQYTGFPQRACLHDDLINACITIDPLGQADDISKALDFMKTEVPEDLPCRYCIQEGRAVFALICGNLDESEAASHTELEWAATDTDSSSGRFHAATARANLARLAFRRGDWEALRESAEEGERLLRGIEGREVALAEMLLWQAILARRENNEDRANALLGESLRRVKASSAVPYNYFYDTLCIYHEMGGELEQALKVRAEELREMEGKGRFFEECEARIDYCRLLARMGKPMSVEIEKAKELARNLRAPSPHIAELQRIESSEF